MARDATVPQKVVTQEIVRYTETLGGRIEAVVAVGEWIMGRVISPDPDDRSRDYTVPDYFAVDDSYKVEKVEIEGDDYDALMSDSPAWHPEKKGNMFEKNDLWHCIDAKANGVPLEHGNAPDAPHTPPDNPGNSGNSSDSNGGGV